MDLPRSRWVTCECWLETRIVRGGFLLWPAIDDTALVRNGTPPPLARSRCAGTDTTECSATREIAVHAAADPLRPSHGISRAVFFHGFAEAAPFRIFRIFRIFRPDIYRTSRVRLLHRMRPSARYMHPTVYLPAIFWGGGGQAGNPGYNYIPHVAAAGSSATVAPTRLCATPAANSGPSVRSSSEGAVTGRWRGGGCVCSEMGRLRAYTGLCVVACHARVPGDGATCVASCPTRRRRARSPARRKRGEGAVT